MPRALARTPLRSCAHRDRDVASNQHMLWCDSPLAQLGASASAQPPCHAYPTLLFYHHLYLLFFPSSIYNHQQHHHPVS